jgi:glycosyltransferase involved in cell wall biosynthesis
VTLHSTETLAGLSPDDRQDAVAGLQRVGRVIVHTVADIERLRGHGIAENVVLMPHGVPEAMSAGGAVIPRLRSLVPSATGNDAPVIGCYGFFLPGKGIPELIEAIAMLRRSWPGARLRLVDAAYGTPESDAEILRCRTAVAVAGLDDAVEFHIDFLPDSESRDLLAGCDLVVLAYQSSGEASSAALRSALTTCVPVAVTPLAVFEDAEDAVWRFDGVTPDLIAAGIDHLLSHQELRVELQARADSWKARHRWVDIAERMDGLLRGLVQERRIAADAKRRQ